MSSELAKLLEIPLVVGQQMCNPNTEITKNKGYTDSGLKPESELWVYKGDEATFICETSGYVTDVGENVTIQCDENGNFDQPNPWPVCRPPTCTVSERPTETGNLSATTTVCW